MSNAKGQKDWHDFDLEISEFVIEEENRYSIKAVATLTKNKQPKEGTEIQFFVAGKLVGSEPTDENGRAIVDFTINYTPAILIIEAVMKEHPFLTKKIKKRVREEKKEDKLPRLNFLSAFEDGDKYVVIIARTSTKGAGIAGKISYFDPDAKKIKQQACNDCGIAKIKFAIKNERQKTFFFPTERPGDKDRIEKEIPAKKIPAPPRQCAPEPEKPKTKLADRLKEAYRRGRQG